MKTLIVSGKTVEDAIKDGLAQWNVTKEQVSVRVVQQPSKGFLGLFGVRPAKVELMLLTPAETDVQAGLSEERSARISAVATQPSNVGQATSKETSSTEAGPDPIVEAKQFIVDVARSMGLAVEVAVHKRKDVITLDISGADLGLLIGRRGQTLDSLQYLTNLVANRYAKHHLRVILDAEQFRDRRKQTLESLSERLANKVIRTRKEVVLEPMTSLERKVIHAKLQDHPKVKTYSKGEEPNRRVVITIK
ncbi:RNA-binding cell elongation regulator Jag/EloR [Paenibacillus sp. 481]|uniref:RNA-binding cell elongation regulator Jag/EloR n=1 Tax=Paenibacillus sp. 481 TaxID=2835869 RepID=UPI001E46CCB0|nr:RNA-binding cell elongation regulator Jag/EloR [Paenibacillus sp. 481]UHA75368.1 protein jag [Paenibacillus sp. 481]